MARVKTTLGIPSNSPCQTPTQSDVLPDCAATVVEAMIRAQRVRCMRILLGSRPRRAWTGHPQFSCVLGSSVPAQAPYLVAWMGHPRFADRPWFQVCFATAMVASDPPRPMVSTADDGTITIDPRSLMAS